MQMLLHCTLGRCGACFPTSSALEGAPPLLTLLSNPLHCPIRRVRVCANLLLQVRVCATGHEWESEGHGHREMHNFAQSTRYQCESTRSVASARRRQCCVLCPAEMHLTKSLVFHDWGCGGLHGLMELTDVGCFVQGVW